MPNCSSGAVELMLCMEDKENFECFDQFGMRLEVSLVQSIQHVEEVFHVAQAFLRLVVLSSDSMPISVGSNRRNPSQKSVDLLVSDCLVFVDSLAHQAGVLLRVQSRQGSHCTAKHAHRMSIVSERVHHVQQIFVDEGMLHDFLGEVGEFLLSGKLPPDDEVGDFKEAAPLSQILNGVAPVLQDSFISIYEADGGGAGDGIHIAGVIAPERFTFVAEFGEIVGEEVVSVGAELVSFARARVCDSDGVFARDLFSNETQPVHLIGYQY